MVIPPSKPQTQEGRILAALGLVRGPLPHAVTQWLIRYYDYLAAHLCLPFEARCPEDTRRAPAVDVQRDGRRVAAAVRSSAQDGAGLKCKALRGDEASRDTAGRSRGRKRPSERATHRGLLVLVLELAVRSENLNRRVVSSAAKAHRNTQEHGGFRCARHHPAILSFVHFKKEESMSRQKTYANIVETTFDTPLVKLNRVVPAGAATVLLETRILQPLQQRQGPHRAGHDRDRGKGGHPATAYAHHRTDQRQHGHRAGLRGRRQGLSPDAHHAGVDEPGAPGVVASAGRRPRADSRQGRHARRDRQGPGVGGGDAR